MKKFLILILLVLMSTACVSAATEEPATAVTSTTAPLLEANKPVMIRVHNSSDRVFDRVEVQFPEQTEQYGVVGVDSSSDYRAVSQAYRYAYVQVMVGGEAFTLQPIDYVGESLLPPGNYTYVLDISDGQLLLTLAEGDEAIAAESVAVVTATAVPPTEMPPTEAPTEVPATTLPAVDLNGTQWNLIAYGAPDRPASVLPDTQPTAEFLDGQVTGTTGCNQYFAPYTQSGDTLTTGAVASTRRACAQDVGQQEMEILQGWDTAVSYELSQDTLIVHHENGVLVFMAAGAVQPETAVVSPDDTPETILLFSPANGSRLTSPFTVSGESDYAFEGTLNVELVTLDGQNIPLSNGFAMLDVPEMGMRGPYSGEMAFAPPAEPTQARLSVMMISARDGHIEHLASAIVTLLPEGETAEIQTADPHPEAIAIHSPEFLSTVSGGTVSITGFAAPTFEQNLVIEILDEQANVVGSGFTTIASGMGEWGPFTADVAYAVTAVTNGSICVQDISPADGGIAHRNCVAVTLEP
ncbi:MAG: META domain-containing protein [Ardenticatenaceae bacterium]|nr:META domain-containing protein [Ardenticatenaceae bacterium]